MFRSFLSTTTTLLILLQAIHGVVTAASNPRIRRSEDTSFSQDGGQCIQSLLAEGSGIPSSSFTSTSELVESTGARRYSAESIRSDDADLAWCPGKRVGSDLSEYIEIDMGQLNVITKLVISGVLAEGGNSRFTPYFYVKYKREVTEERWRSYRQLYPKKTSQLTGSADAVVAKFVLLDPPLIARWIRIYPYRDTPGLVCIRLEAYGCQFTDDLVEYQIPEGSVAVPPYQAESLSDLSTRPESFTDDNGTHYYQAGGGSAFSDVCYDGYRVEPGSLLDGGLGCLTDLSAAPQNTAPTLSQSSIAGSPSLGSVQAANSNRWFVGWHRSRWSTSKGKQDDVVDMLFRFANVRSFSLLRIYASNNYMEKIRLPRRVEARFSVRGSLFSGQPVVARDLVPDNRTTGVMTIELDLKGRFGRFVQLKLFFAEDWLLLSELKFYSDVATESVVLDEPNTPRRSKKEPIPVTTVPPDPNRAISAELIKNPYGGLPTVITLALLIASFLLVICFASIWFCWKRRSWQQTKRLHSRTLNIMSDNSHGPNGQLGGCNGIFSGIQLGTGGQMLSTDGTLNRNPTIVPNDSVFQCQQRIIFTGSPQDNNTNEKQHLTDSNRMVTNRLSGTSGPSEEVSESEPFTKHQPERRRQTRSGFLTSLTAAICPTKRERARACPAVANPHTKTSGRFDINAQNAGGSPDNEVDRSPPDPVVPSTYRNSLPFFQNTNQTVENGYTGFPYNQSVVPGRSAVQTVNGLLQLDLSSTQPSMLINGQPLIRLPGQPRADGGWHMHPGYSNSTLNSASASVNMSGVNPEMGLYTTVGGESDADSNCASTMSPDYATTSHVNEYPGLAPTLSQLQQQRQVSAALLAINQNIPGQMTYLPPKHPGIINVSVPFSPLPQTMRPGMGQPGIVPTLPPGTTHPLIFSNQIAPGLGPGGPMGFSNTLSRPGRQYDQYSQQMNPSQFCIGQSKLGTNTITAALNHVQQQQRAGLSANCFDRSQPNLMNVIALTNPALAANCCPSIGTSQRTSHKGRNLDNSDPSDGDHPSSSLYSIPQNTGQVQTSQPPHLANPEARNSQSPDSDPWIKSSLVRMNRFENSGRYSPKTRPPVPPSSPPPPPPIAESELREQSSPSFP
ncbi:unnamed protein product [Calicophoron daubneyi]|uniref:F5/8 type C domain-containing protein n=1 Tax=Calicophoron daubneyi TaxID=300641 RepID=A0AAV2TY75_CALDB